MQNAHDDLDAIRTIIDTLTPFEPDEQKRIVRWAFEKLGLSFGSVAPLPPPSSTQTAVPQLTPPSTPAPSNRNIKSFIDAKNPANDMQFAAAVAYFYAFEALEEHKKAEVGTEDLQEACRLTGRQRLTNPGQTLRNAAYNGLLDKGSEKGSYKINTVGENLVALTLPVARASGGKPKVNRRVTKAPVAKKVAKKSGGKAIKAAATKVSKNRKQ